jgi:hypothetical protein
MATSDSRQSSIPLLAGSSPPVHNAAVHPNRPRVVTALSLFFVFGTLMSGLAGMMLMFPGGVLEPLWRLNTRSHQGLAAMGAWAVILMAMVCGACATAALGLLKCARWGYLTALVILSINLVGDTLNAWIAHDWRTLIGLPIGGAMIAYLVMKRSVFGDRGGSAPTSAN